MSRTVVTSYSRKIVRFEVCFLFFPINCSWGGENTVGNSHADYLLTGCPQLLVAAVALVSRAPPLTFGSGDSRSSAISSKGGRCGRTFASFSLLRLEENTRPVYLRSAPVGYRPACLLTAPLVRPLYRYQVPGMVYGLSS